MPKAPSPAKSKPAAKPGSTRSSASKDGASKSTKPTTAKPTLDKSTFLASAKPYLLQLQPTTTVSADPLSEIEIKPKAMGTGSFGWSGTKHATLPLVGSSDVQVMITVNITVKGSKKGKEEENLEEDKLEES